jgi:hypothetical protein
MPFPQLNLVAIQIINLCEVIDDSKVSQVYECKLSMKIFSNGMLLSFNPNCFDFK